MFNQNDTGFLNPDGAPMIPSTIAQDGPTADHDSDERRSRGSNDRKRDKKDKGGKRDKKNKKGSRRGDDIGSGSEDVVERELQ